MKKSFGYIKATEVGPNRILVIMSNIEQTVTGFEQFIVSYDVFNMLPRIGRRKIECDLFPHDLRQDIYYRLRHFIKRNGETL